MSREPVALGVAIYVFVQAVTGLIVAFGVTVTPDQAAAIMVTTAAGLGLLVAAGVRRLVTPVEGAAASDYTPKHARETHVQARDNYPQL